MELFDINQMLIYSRLDAFRQNSDTIFFTLTVVDNYLVYCGWNNLLEKLKYSPVNPLVFTEHGVLMAASILNSAHAVEVSLFIVRAFVALRRAISENKEIARKITQFERKLADHDDQIIAIIEAIKNLSGPQPVAKERRIDFHSE